MRKLNLKLGSIKEMLSKEQMKKISGGEYGPCLEGAEKVWVMCCSDINKTDCSFCVEICGEQTFSCGAGDWSYGPYDCDL